MTPRMEMILQQIVPGYDKQHFCRQPPIFVKSKIIFADRYLTEFIINVLSIFTTYNLLEIIFFINCSNINFSHCSQSLAFYLAYFLFLLLAFDQLTNHYYHVTTNEICTQLMNFRTLFAILTLLCL